MDKSIPLSLNQNAVQLLKPHCTPYTSSFTFNLTLTHPIPLPQLMSFLILTYQALTNHNHLLQYMIIPFPISMVICDKHKKLALGGTFDNIHSGHYLLLTYARMLVNGELIVGITGPEMLLKKKNQQFVQSYWTREQSVRRFLQRMGGEGSMRLFMLPDGYGPTITEGDITGLVVTKQTEAGGKTINNIRKEKGFPELQVYVMELIEDTDKSSGKVSSTTIREFLMKKNKFENQDRAVYRKEWFRLFEDIVRFKGVQMNESLQRFMTLTQEEIFSRYSQYWRYYHTNYHILTMLKDFNSSTYTKSLNPFENLSVRLAIFYHDIIYIPKSASNEQDSAKLCESFLKQLSNLTEKDYQDLSKNVSHLILMTKHHKPSADNLPEQLLNDLDMQILNSSQQRYKQYSEQVKLQYGPMFEDPKQFNIKRIQFLKTLDPTKVFALVTPSNIKSNIAWQLNNLTEHAQL